MNPLVLLVLAQVSNPFPGVMLVRHARSAMTITNLCTPGVSLRATRYSERQATPQQWAQAVGAQVAINADFFEFPGWSYILVRARGANEDWPAQAQRLEQPSAYWKFGVGIADLEPNSLVTPGAFVTDVVGAYDSLIVDGQIESFAGQPFMLASYRRSAIGLSKDRRTLYFYASDAPVNGPAMASEMIQMAAEGGAAPIDLATNEDGGGSTQLYVQGQGQIITSGRQVATHLGIYASGSGPAWSCNNPPPRGFVDAADCEGIRGWAQDPSVPNAPIDVRFDFGSTVRADRRREDLCTAIGSCEHGFELPLALSLADGQPHAVHVYGVDSENGATTELGQSPVTVTCALQPPRGVLRHVPTWEAFQAWKFDLVRDVQHVASAEATWDDWPASPDLVRVKGVTFVLDHGMRRRVSWSLGDAPGRDVDEGLYPEGPALPARPWLVQGQGLAIYFADALTPEAAAPRVPVAEPARLADDSGDVVGACSVAPSGLLLLAAMATLLRCRRRGG